MDHQGNGNGDGTHHNGSGNGTATADAAPADGAHVEKQVNPNFGWRFVLAEEGIIEGRKHVIILTPETEKHLSEKIDAIEKMTGRRPTEDEMLSALVEFSVRHYAIEGKSNKVVATVQGSEEIKPKATMMTPKQKPTTKPKASSHKHTPKKMSPKVTAAPKPKPKNRIAEHLEKEEENLNKKEYTCVCKRNGKLRKITGKGPFGRHISLCKEAQKIGLTTT